MYTEDLQKAKRAQTALREVTEEQINIILTEIAEGLSETEGYILGANAQDLVKMKQDDPRYDRLRLTPERIEGLKKSILEIRDTKSPLEEKLRSQVREDQMKVELIRVPIGTIGMIYEARPNVTIDAACMALKTRNSIVLKGGSDAQKSNQILVSIIHGVLERNGIPTATVTLLPADREAVKALLQAEGIIDIAIPRGSQGLINMVREEAKVPVIETGAGVVHLYLDASYKQLTKAEAIIFSSKVRRPSVCNALDTLLIQESLLPKLPQLLQRMRGHVTLYAEWDAREVLQEHGYEEAHLRPATEETWSQEHLGYSMGIKVVSDVEGAVEHMQRYGSGHSEAILTESQAQWDYFCRMVDAANLFWNTEPGYADGGEYGLGAEIGISTQKLHARGPMGLEALTTTQWRVRGQGQWRMEGLEILKEE